MNLPTRVEVWKAKDGSLVVDTRCNTYPLFPANISVVYQLSPQNVVDAVKILRCPENFNLLLDRFISNTEGGCAGQLDDALKAVAKENINNI